MKAPTDLGAGALARAIAAGELTSEAVVRAHLERIAEVDPQLCAVVQLAADAALETARACDRERAAGSLRGPLHGVPFTCKDWIETADLPCAAGFAAREGHVPRRDATAVARLRAVGAVLLGKTNTGERNEVYDEPHNPHVLDRTPGASSSGEAAIVAAGGSPLGLASDSGGSIRYPAHCCGVAGLKPTQGRVPATGHFPRINPMNDPRTQIGPIGREVADLELALRVIAGPDWRDASVAPVPLGESRDVVLEGLRVATWSEQEGAVPTAETLRVVETAAAALAERGLAIERARPDGVDRALDLTLRYWRRVRSIAGRTWLPDGPFTLSAEDVERSLFEWGVYRTDMLAFLERYDLILTPACPEPAPYPPTALAHYVYTLPFSLTGWPCVVVRAGTGPGGLPIGVQVAARPWREDVVLAAARAIEQALGPWAPPAFAASID